MRKRAAERFGGNLSAVIEEGPGAPLEEEGREALARWLLEGGVTLHTEDAEQIRTEWSHDPKVRRRSHRAVA